MQMQPNPARAGGVRARPTASGHSALPRRRRPFIWKPGQVLTDCDVLLSGRGAGGPAGRGPSDRTPSSLENAQRGIAGLLPWVFYTQYFFFRPSLIDILNETPYFHARAQIPRSCSPPPRFHRYSLEERLQFPNITAPLSPLRLRRTAPASPRVWEWGRAGQVSPPARGSQPEEAGLACGVARGSRRITRISLLGTFEAISLLTWLEAAAQSPLVRP